MDASSNVVHVIIVDDVPARRDGTGTAVLGTDGKPLIMTDGCGLISQRLAALLPSVSSGLLNARVNAEASSLADKLAALGNQMRLYVHGMIAKGDSTAQVIAEIEAALYKGTEAAPLLLE